MIIYNHSISGEIKVKKGIFENPVAEIYMFENEDIITTSGEKDEWTNDYIIPEN